MTIFRVVQNRSICRQQNKFDSEIEHGCNISRKQYEKKK